MLIGVSQQEKQEWNKSLQSYQKAKRTKKPFGKQVQKIQHKSVANIIQKEMKFNPVLQSFRDQRQQFKTIEHEQIQKASQQIKYMKNNYKYNTDYDIITFNPSIALPPKYRSISINPQIRKKQYRDPTYQNFNIINGNQYQKEYLEKVEVKPLKNYIRKIKPKEQNFNIINSSYINDQRQQFYINDDKKKEDILNRSQAMRVYDSINGKYYNPEIEDQYQINLKNKQASHGKDYMNKLPPSYIHREGIVQNQVAPLTQQAKQQNQKKDQAKKRSIVRYEVEDQYRSRNDYLTQKRQIQTKNRVHNGRILQQKGKQFNIINSHYYNKNRAEQLYGRSLTKNPYDYSQIMNNSYRYK